MSYRFCIVDVFTEERFGGNQLAVLTDARGLTTEQMQRITAEFGFSESTFVLPPSDPHNHRQVRIFTPASEMPFAGHPNVGTAFVLALDGEVDPVDGTATIVFEEQAGLVPMSIHFEGDRPVRTELTAPEPLGVGPHRDAAAAAAAVGLEVAEIVVATHPPIVASVGLPFLCVEVESHAALGRCRTDAAHGAALLAGTGADGIHVYTRDAGIEGVDIRARMFGIGHGIAEDAATGSANCALAGLLASRDSRPDGELQYSIAQGIEMGRPSRLAARVEKRAGEVSVVRIGGASVLVARGEIEVD